MAPAPGTMRAAEKPSRSAWGSGLRGGFMEKQARAEALKLDRESALMMSWETATQATDSTVSGSRLCSRTAGIQTARKAE